jgi:hypothetical protein
MLAHILNPKRCAQKLIPGNTYPAQALPLKTLTMLHDRDQAETGEKALFVAPIVGCMLKGHHL